MNIFITYLSTENKYRFLTQVDQQLLIVVDKMQNIVQL